MKPKYFTFILCYFFVSQSKSLKLQDINTQFSSEDDPRIVGGSDANKKDWPFIVGCVQGPILNCGGTLIKPKWVLTAGHCIDTLFQFADSGVAIGFSVSEVKKLNEIFDEVTLRENGLYQYKESQVQTVPEKYIIRTERFLAHNYESISVDENKKLANEHDICLHKLEKAADLSGGVKLAKMPTVSPYAGMKCKGIVVGLNFGLLQKEWSIIFIKI